MSVSRLHRRALALLLAFGIGLIGQIGTVAAMSMPSAAPPAATMSHSGGAQHCPGCDDHGSPAGKPMMASCLSGLFCPFAPAIVSESAAKAPVVHATFSPSPSETAHGITVTPDLGPPRSTSLI